MVLTKRLEDKESWVVLYPEDTLQLSIIEPLDYVKEESFLKVDSIGPFDRNVTGADSKVTILINNTVLPFQGLILSWKYQLKPKRTRRRREPRPIRSENSTLKPRRNAITRRPEGTTPEPA